MHVLDKEPRSRTQQRPFPLGEPPGNGPLVLTVGSNVGCRLDRRSGSDNNTRRRRFHRLLAAEQYPPALREPAKCSRGRLSTQDTVLAQ